MTPDIKEEHDSGKGNGSIFGGGEVATVNDAASDVRRREVEEILRAKIRSSGSTKRTSRKPQKKINHGRVKRCREFGRSHAVGYRFANIIRLYSCSAFRYVTLRSNRRFKPGD